GRDDADRLVDGEGGPAFQQIGVRAGTAPLALGLGEDQAAKHAGPSVRSDGSGGAFAPPFIHALPHGRRNRSVKPRSGRGEQVRWPRYFWRKTMTASVAFW